MARISSMTVEKTVQFHKPEDWTGGDMELEVTHIRAVPSRGPRLFDDNIVPITKPRAMAAIAQTNPHAIEMHSIVPPLTTQARQISIVPAASNAPVVASSDKWKQYHDVGLTPPKANNPNKATAAAAKVVVSTYRMLGISILTLIVAVLVGYIGTTVFYFFSKSWVTPTVISANDPKVVQARNELSAAQNARDKLQTDLHDTERAIASEQQFQLEFTKAVEDDLAGRKEALDRVRSLAGSAAATRAHVSGTTSAYATAFAAKQKQDFEAGMIDRNTMMSGTYQVAQMSAGTLALAEKQVELEGAAKDLARQTRALDALAQQQAGTPMSYEVLKIKRDYDASKLALAKALETRDALTAAIKRQDDMIAGLKSSAFLRAVDDKTVVALVPYGNMDNAKPGSTLYACKVSMVWCHEVGTVIEVLPGEVSIKHPHNDSVLRGQMIEMQLTDASAAQNEVLFAGKPLGL